jgi:hypothetical protein
MLTLTMTHDVLCVKVKKGHLQTLKLGQPEHSLGGRRANFRANRP